MRSRLVLQLRSGCFDLVQLTLRVPSDKLPESGSYKLFQPFLIDHRNLPSVPGGAVHELRIPCPHMVSPDQILGGYNGNEPSRC
jgi:hypothetical protein